MEMNDEIEKNFPALKIKASLKGLQMPNSISSRTILYRVYKKLRLNKAVKNPKTCPICDDRVRAPIELAECQKDLSKENNQSEKKELTSKMEKIKLRLEKIDAHDVRRAVQRSWLQQFGEELNDGQCLIYWDFGSHYKDVQVKKGTARQLSGKSNVLCFTLKWLDSNAEVHRRYVDYEADEVHDGYFSTAAVVHLFKESGLILPAFRDIVIGGDGGMCVASTIKALQDIVHGCATIEKFRIVVLCAYHGYNVCDSHFSKLHPLMYRLQSKTPSQYPRAAEDFKSVVENHISNTTVYNLRAKIDEDVISREYYKSELFGPIKLKDRRHFGVIWLKNDDLVDTAEGTFGPQRGWCLAQTLVDTDEKNEFDIPDGFTYPRFIYREFQPSNSSCCQRCSWLYSHPITKKDHVCIFSGRRVLKKKGLVEMGDDLCSSLEDVCDGYEPVRGWEEDFVHLSPGTCVAFNFGSRQPDWDIGFITNKYSLNKKEKNSGCTHIVDFCGLVKACKLSKCNYLDVEPSLCAQSTWCVCLDIRGECDDDSDDGDD